MACATLSALRSELEAQGEEVAVVINWDAPVEAKPDKTLTWDVHLHLLEDEIYHLRCALGDMIRLHYRLDEDEKAPNAD